MGVKYRDPFFHYLIFILIKINVHIFPDAVSRELESCEPMSYDDIRHSLDTARHSPDLFISDESSDSDSSIHGRLKVLI